MNFASPNEMGVAEIQRARDEQLDFKKREAVLRNSQVWMLYVGACEAGN
jgi:hypothetical protein